MMHLLPVLGKLSFKSSGCPNFVEILKFKVNIVNYQLLSNHLLTNKEPIYYTAQSALIAARKYLENLDGSQAAEKIWLAVHLSLRDFSLSHNFEVKSHRAKKELVNCISEQAIKDWRDKKRFLDMWSDMEK